MSIPSLKTPLLAGKYYHLYNRGNNKERLFYYHGNYDFFLQKYFMYLGSIVDTYGYCLLPNHFHFLIRIRDSETNPRKVSNQFRKLFISYARQINNQEKRIGCLLSKNFRRIEINNENYLKRLILYIHLNPKKHGIYIDITSYKYSSFHKIISNQTERINIIEIMDWFGSYENLIEDHRIFRDDKKINGLKMEE